MARRDSVIAQRVDLDQYPCPWAVRRVYWKMMPLRDIGVISVLSRVIAKASLPATPNVIVEWSTWPS